MTICARTDTSRADDRFVGDDEVGLQGQRPGDADALALATGEGVRVAVGGVLGRPHRSSRATTWSRAAAADLRQAVDDERLGDELEHGHPRVQRWRRDPGTPAASAGAAGAARSPVVAVMSSPWNMIRPADRIDAPQDGAPDRGLARAGLADEAERLAVVDVNETSSTAWTHLTCRPQNPLRPTGKRTEMPSASIDRSSVGTGRRGSVPSFDHRRDRFRRSANRAAQLGGAEAGDDLVLVARRALRASAAPGGTGHGVRAAGGERAARRRPAQVGRRAVDRDEAVEHDVDPRRRPQQPDRVRMGRSGVEVGGRGVLDDLAGVHHRDPVAHAGDDAEVVGDQQHGDAEALLQVGEEVEDLRLDRDVERRRRLVGDEQLGFARQRHGDEHPLAHAAGHLERVLLDALRRVGDADHVEQLDRLAPRPPCGSSCGGGAAPRPSGCRR